MPRPPRIHFPGALFHAMARGNGGQKIFLNPGDYQSFLKTLAEVKRRKPFRLYAYCLMPNHFHLLVEVDQFPISIIMHRLMLHYAKYFNIPRKRFGHVFQNRFKSILCQKDAYLLQLLRYIHLNPVRANLVGSPSQWRWSSHHAYVHPGHRLPVDAPPILTMFHPDPSRSRKLYVQFVESGIGAGHEDDFYPATSKPYLGDEAFIAEHHDLAHRRHCAPLPKKQLDLIEVAKTHLANTSVIELQSASRARGVAGARKKFILHALREGHSPSKISRFLNRSPSFISKIIARNPQN